MLLLILALTGAADAQDCNADALSTALDGAETHFADLNVDGFDAGADEAAVLLTCMTDVIPPAVAAQTHRIFGIRAFLSGDEPRSEVIFAAARRVDPDYDFPDTLLPRPHSIRDRYAAVDLGDRDAVSIPPPEAGVIYFDGVEGLERSETWPTLVQIVDGEGALHSTSWLQPDESLPPYKRATAAVVAVDPPAAPPPDEPVLPTDPDPKPDKLPKEPKADKGFPVVPVVLAGIGAGALGFGLSQGAIVTRLDNNDEFAGGCVWIDQVEGYICNEDGAETVYEQRAAALRADIFGGLGIALLLGGTTTLLIDGNGVGVRGRLP